MFNRPGVAESCMQIAVLFTHSLIKVKLVLLKDKFITQTLQLIESTS